MKCFVTRTVLPHCSSYRLIIHGAPHRRMHRAVLQKYRDCLKKAFLDQAGVLTPIDEPIELSLVFIDPTSPDLDNLLTALYMALDGKTLRGPGVLETDGLIVAITHLSKMYVKDTPQVD